MGLSTAISTLEQVFFNTQFNGSFLIMNALLIFGSMAIITRRITDWKNLALPIMVGWNYIGANISPIFITLSAILFVTDTLTIKKTILGLRSIGKTLGKGALWTLSPQTRTLKSIQKQARKIDVKEQVEGLKGKIRNWDMYGTTDKETIKKQRTKEALQQKKMLKNMTLLNVQGNEEVNPFILMERKKKVDRTKLGKKIGRMNEEEIMRRINDE